MKRREDYEFGIGDGSDANSSAAGAPSPQPSPAESGTFDSRTAGAVARRLDLLGVDQPPGNCALAGATVGAAFVNPAVAAADRLQTPTRTAGAGQAVGSSTDRRRWLRRVVFMAAAVLPLISIALSLKVYHRLHVRAQSARQTAASAAKTRASTNIVDLISFSDAMRDGGELWEIQNRELLFNRSDNGMSRFDFPYQPPAEYDFTLDFTRAQAHGFISQHLVHERVPFDFTMNYSTTQKQKRVCGFERVANKALRTDTSAAPLDPNAFAAGERHTATVQVRRKHVTAWLDGIKLCEWTPEDGELSCPVAPDIRRLGVRIVGGRNRITIHRAEVVEISGPGKRLGVAPVIPLASAEISTTAGTLWPSLSGFLLPPRLTTVNSAFFPGRFRSSVSEAKLDPSSPSGLEMPVRSHSEGKMSTNFTESQNVSCDLADAGGEIAIGVKMLAEELEVRSKGDPRLDAVAEVAGGVRPAAAEE